MIVLCCASRAARSAAAPASAANANANASDPVPAPVLVPVLIPMPVLVPVPVPTPVIYAGTSAACKRWHVKVTCVALRRCRCIREMPLHEAVAEGLTRCALCG